MDIAGGVDGGRNVALSNLRIDNSGWWPHK